MLRINIKEVKPADIVRFRKYSMRVETVLHGNGSIAITGRTTNDGCPIETKRFLGGLTVSVERGII